MLFICVLYAYYLSLQRVNNTSAKVQNFRAACNSKNTLILN